MKNFFCVLCLLIAMLCATLAFFPMINNAFLEHNSTVGPDTESSELPGDDPSELPGDDPSELPGDDPSDDTPEVSGYTVTIKAYRYPDGCDCPLVFSYRNSSGAIVSKSISEISSVNSDLDPQEFLDSNNEFTIVILEDVCSILDVDFSACGYIRVYEEDFSLVYDGSEYNNGTSVLNIIANCTYIIQGLHQ